MLLIDEERALAMLARGLGTIRVASVLEQIESWSLSIGDSLSGGGGRREAGRELQGRRLAHRYLHRLFIERHRDFNTEKYEKFHARMIPLYIEFERDALLDFMRRSFRCPMQIAHDALKAAKPPMVKEM